MMNILNKLTIKHLKMNKKRTIVTIMGVVLSTALMVGIGLIFSSIYDYVYKESINDYGPHHVFMKIPEEKTDLLEKNSHIKDYFYLSGVGFAKLEGSENAYKPYLYIASLDKKESFSHLHLLSGRYPENDKEIVISKHISLNGGVSFEVGDTITLQLGKRFLFDEEISSNFVHYDMEEEFRPTKTQEYTVVGVVERSYLESYSAPGYMVFTLNSSEKESSGYAYITYKNVKDTYKLTEILATSLGYQSNFTIGNDVAYYDEIEYNNTIISLSGVTPYNNVSSALMSVIVIILGLISIGCIVVIYNSFAISVMERKKQFGLFASIGATPKQLRKTVFFEAFLVSIIGIPLGILGAIIGIGIVVQIVNTLLSEIVTIPFSLSFYPLFIIVPILFMIVTIYISAYLPAFRASKTSPIVSIRQNDDIKRKKDRKFLSRFVHKVFGIEGEIAYKNKRRNKKKYRITIISLVTSIVLFVSFSGLIDYALNTTSTLTHVPNYNLSVTGNYFFENDKSYSELLERIRAFDEVEEVVKWDSVNFFLEMEDGSVFDPEYIKKCLQEFIDGGEAVNSYFRIIRLDAASYETYKKEVGIKENKPILVNQTRVTDYESSDYKVHLFTPFSHLSELPLTFESVSSCEGMGCEIEDRPLGITLKDIVLTEKIPHLLESEIYNYGFMLIVDDATFQAIVEKRQALDEDFTNYMVHTFISAPTYQEVDPYLSKLVESNTYLSISYRNIDKEYQQAKNGILIVKILVYGFITLVTLIGVTSVFNTIHTSIALRRKEFSMLRSVGLTPHGFNKILYFESLFVGLESLFIGIPLSLLVIYLLYMSFDRIVSFSSMLIPFKSIGIAFIGVFVIVLLSMWYASSKIKKENILDALREENI